LPSETLIAFNAQASVSQGFSAGGKSPALDASKVHAICMASRQQAMSIGEDVASPILGTDFKEPQLVCIQETASRENPKSGPSGKGWKEGTAYTLDTNPTPQAVCYEHHGNDSRIREAGDTSPTITSRAGTGGNNLPILCLRERAGKPGGGKDPLVSNGVSLTLATGNDQAVCFQQNQRDEVRLVDGDGGVAGALQASPGMKQQNMLMVDRANGKWPADVAPTLNARFGEKLGLENQHIDQGAPMFVSGGTPMHIRRFTPRECERLQGFPDDWTKIPWKGKDAEDCPDSHRYKACGNSMAVPVMRWIGERINKQENDKTRKANRQHSLP
jgi:site-specific DNA-cytosine methylase